VVGHPNVLKSVEVALGDAPEDLLYNRYISTL
jgi:hypothetical protein